MIADSEELGVPGIWGGGWWVSVSVRTTRRPWATCWTAKKVKTPGDISCKQGVVRECFTEAEPEVVVGDIGGHG